MLQAAQLAAAAASLATLQHAQQQWQACKVFLV
jgi:hypothetical protein